jgi:MFS transporter, ACS family, tartrate transporter
VTTLTTNAARPETDPAALGRVTLRKLNWRLLPFLLLLYIVAYVDRVNVGFAALQMNEDLGFSAAMYGFGAGVFFAGYALCEVPSNLILARVGARIWIARILVTWGAVSASMMFVHSPASFYAMRFLLGVAEAGFFPGIIWFLGNWFPQAQRARAVAWFMAAIPLSIVIGGPLAGLLLEMDGIRGLAGWQWLFLLEGLPAILLGFIAYFGLRDRPHEVHWLSAAEKTWLDAKIRAEQDHAREQHGVGLLRSLAHPMVWALGLICFVLQSGSYGLTLWVPQILKGFGGLSDLEVGLIAAVPYAFATVGMVLVGISSDRTGERILHLAATMFLAAAGFAASALIRSPAPALVVLTVAAIGDLAGRGPFWALPGRFLAGSASAAGIALINTFGAVGGFVGPTLIGLVKSATSSYTGGLLTIAAALFIGAIAVIALRGARTLKAGPP